MKWVSVNTTSSKENFELWEDEKVLAGYFFQQANQVCTHCK